jgi:hypothetical protein
MEDKRFMPILLVCLAAATPALAAGDHRALLTGPTTFERTAPALEENTAGPSVSPDPSLTSAVKPPPGTEQVSLGVGGRHRQIVYFRMDGWAPRNTIVLVACWKSPCYDNGFVQGAEQAFSSGGYTVIPVASLADLDRAEAQIQRRIARTPGTNVVLVGHGMPGETIFSPTFTLNPQNAAHWGRALRGALQIFLLSCDEAANPVTAQRLATASGGEVVASDDTMYDFGNQPGVMGDSHLLHVFPQTVGFATDAHGRVDSDPRPALPPVLTTSEILPPPVVPILDRLRSEALRLKLREKARIRASSPPA